MPKAEKIKREIDILPADMLEEVEKFIKSLKTRKKFHGPFITTQLILVELANSLCLPQQKPLAVNIIEKMQQDPLTTIVSLSSDRFEKAFSLFKKRSDKAWGFIDCFSFIVMDEWEIKQALTFDEHFR